MSFNFPGIVFLLMMILQIAGLNETAYGISQSAQTDVYVSTSGDDRWSGKYAEPLDDLSDGPLASLDQARIRVREYITKGLNAPVNVWIRGGEYELSSTIVFGPEDSGTREFPVYYRAYQDEKPVFTGANKLIDWRE